MCIYVLLVPLCGHSPSLLFGPSCHSFFHELDNITQRSAWEPPGATDFCDACRHDAFQYSLQQQQQRQRQSQNRHQHQHLQYSMATDAPWSLVGAMDDDGLRWWPGGRDSFGSVQAGVMYDLEPERVGVGWRTRNS
ncbi:unnamed protein product [Parascedosporium putredinis]|uniref:Uncharacterized protein n=1 Tax=Parascedosporium putredinis TaxID=1442378 RepID=A0A9P1MDF3_9PEZI|nr:unnamed protein product [Parascedosporium putredinis]CAI8003511.1 unnamed protein product [Parascedosporium putredinis]